MNKKLRQQVYEKFGGKCAYTGLPLPEDWQVDHMTSKIQHEWTTYYRHGDLDTIKKELKTVDNIDNLVPTLRIVNHYKRSLDLEGFRRYMLLFHKRLAKLPKNTSVQRTKERKIYMYKIAEVFGISPENPFSGVFYFETLTLC